MISGHQKYFLNHLPTVHKGCLYRTLLSSIVKSHFKGLRSLTENELCPRAVDNLFQTARSYTSPSHCSCLSGHEKSLLAC